MKLELAGDLKQILESEKELQIPVSWVSKKKAVENYLNRGFGNSYDFGQAV